MTDIYFMHRYANAFTRLNSIMAIILDQFYFDLHLFADLKWPDLKKCRPKSIGTSNDRGLGHHYCSRSLRKVSEHHHLDQQNLNINLATPPPIPQIFIYNLLFTFKFILLGESDHLLNLIIIKVKITTVLLWTLCPFLIQHDFW